MTLLIQAKINECIKLVRMSNRKLNEIRLGKNESPEHRDKKLEICIDLIKQNKSFITEAIFVSGGRADILVLDDFKVIEIVKTETNKSIEYKKQSYPKGLKIEVIEIGK